MIVNTTWTGVDESFKKENVDIHPTYLLYLHALDSFPFFHTLSNMAVFITHVMFTPLSSVKWWTTETMKSLVDIM